MRKEFDKFFRKQQSLKLLSIQTFQYEDIFPIDSCTCTIQSCVIESNLYDMSAISRLFFDIGQNLVKIVNMKFEGQIGIAAVSKFNHVGTKGSLKEIDLSNCSITDEMVSPIASLLNKNKQIVKLNLTSNKISDSGIAYLFSEGLVENSILASFRFPDNIFKKKGKRAILKNLFKLKSLKELDIGMIALENTAEVEYVSSYLSNQTSLKTIILPKALVVSED